MVSVIRSNGVVRRAPPGAFGAITNAHSMRNGGPWDSTFEPQFDQPDNELPEFVQWLSALQTALPGTHGQMVDRIMPQVLDDARRKMIGRITASLLARSPSIRNLIKLGTEQFRTEFELDDPTADKSLIAANQQRLYPAYRKRMSNSGRWAILFTDEKEFIAGDGFLHNFPASQDAISSGTKLVLPILPTTAIIYMCPMQYPTEPRLVTLRMNSNEVDSLNDITQVYAREFLFYREEKPSLSADFRIGAHKQFKYHGHSWLDPLLDDLSQYNRWGEGAAASFRTRRPYTESLEGNHWLDQLADG